MLALDLNFAMLTLNQEENFTPFFSSIRRLLQKIASKHKFSCPMSYHYSSWNIPQLVMKVPCNWILSLLYLDTCKHSAKMSNVTPHWKTYMPKTLEMLSKSSSLHVYVADLSKEAISNKKKLTWTMHKA